MISQSNIISALEKTLSSTTGEELDATRKILQDICETSLHEYLEELSKIMHETLNNTRIRNAAAIELKHFLNKAKSDQKWTSLPVDVKNAIKKNTLETLGTEGTRPSLAAPCIAYIAFMELPFGQWPELMNILTGDVVNTDTADALKESSLEAIGHICYIFISSPDGGGAEILNVHSKNISEAIIYGMTKETSSNYIKVTAITALTQAFRYVKENFESESERHFLLQLVCYSAQSTDIELRLAAFKCLSEIVLLYYSSMDLYMKPTMFPIALEALKSDIDQIRTQGIEFWMNVCTIEVNLQKDQASFDYWNSIGFDKPPKFKSRGYMKAALPYLMPILLQQFVEEKKLNENYAQNVNTIMDDYLYYLSTSCSDLVYPYFVSFMEEQIKQEDWRCQYIAIKLFLGVDSKNLKKLLQSVMPFLLEMLKDTNEDIKCLTLKAIRDTYIKGPSTYLSEPYLKPLIQVLLQQLNSTPKIATAATEALSSLSYAAFFTPSDAKPCPDDTSSVLSTNKYSFQLIVHNILETSSRTDSVGLCKAACEALRDIIRYTPEDCYDVFKELTREILDRLVTVVQSDSQPENNGCANNEELQACLVTSLEGVLKRVRPCDAPEICDNIVFALLQLYNCTSYKSTHLRKAVLGVVSIILLVLGDKFLMFTCIVEPVLVAGLRDCDEEEVYTISLRLTRGIYQALGWRVLPYCHVVIPTLAKHLKSNQVRESLKRETLLVFEAIVTGVGSAIKSYVTTILSSMIEASQAEVAQFAYLNVYSQIIKVLRDDYDVYALMQPYLSGMMRLVASIADDKCRSDVCVGAASDLLATICNTFGGKVRQLVDTEPIRSMVSSGRLSQVDKTNAAATCAHIEMEKLKNVSLKNN